MPTAHITDISTLPLFDRITPADCTLLFDCLGCRIRRYAKDEHIRLERELDGNVGTILEGTVHLYKEDVWGGRALIAIGSYHIIADDGLVNALTQAGCTVTPVK